MVSGQVELTHRRVWNSRFLCSDTYTPHSSWESKWNKHTRGQIRKKKVKFLKSRGVFDWCQRVRWEVTEDMNISKGEDGVGVTDGNRNLRRGRKLIHVLFWSALLYGMELWGGELCTTKQCFQSETEIQCDTPAGRHRPQYLQFMTKHTTSAAISGTHSVSTPLTVSWLVALGHIDLCVPAHDQTHCIKPKPQS